MKISLSYHKKVGKMQEGSSGETVKSWFQYRKIFLQNTGKLASNLASYERLE